MALTETGSDRSMTITVHHLEFSRSLRALWLLEELSLPFEIVRYARTPEFRAPSELAKVHPLGRAPVVEVDSLVLAESGAIIEYFAEREGKLRPTERRALLDYRFFLHFAEGSAMPPLLVHLLAEKVGNAPVPFFVKPIAAKIADGIRKNFSSPAIDVHFNFVDRHLSSSEYFAGDEFSGADIQMFYAVEAALARGKGEWRHIQRWRDAVTARPAYVRAEAKGGPAMPKEM